MKAFLCALFAEVIIVICAYPSNLNEMENILMKLEDLHNLVEEQNLLTKDYLDLKETSNYLSLSESALYKMTSRNEIPFYKPGGKKIYFKRSELNDWIETGKVESISGVVENIETYLNKKVKSIVS